MELEEMKSLWEDLSVKVEKQEKIQKDILMEITQKKYRQKIGHIAFSEILGSIICFACAGYFIYKFPVLQNPINQVLMLFNILVMMVIPVFSLRSIWNLNQVDLGKSSPSEVMEKFTKNKRRFWKVQKYGLYLSGVFMLSILPPMAELAGEPSLVEKSWFWWGYVLFGLVFLFFFARFVMNKYKKALKDSEKAIQDLD
jgi:hypothetical protein